MHLTFHTRRLFEGEYVTDVKLVQQRWLNALGANWPIATALTVPVAVQRWGFTGFA
ncbi:hypothetical protein MBT84_46270 [Streptomyces sp. MBT84]|nr:hypothetical protein [Streptomyces sp. MBT84]